MTLLLFPGSGQTTMRLGNPLWVNRNVFSRLSPRTRPCWKWQTSNATHSRLYTTEPTPQKKFPTFADEMRNLWKWLRNFRNPEKDRSKDWILGNEVVVFHLARPHKLYSLMNVFPFVAILWGAARLDSLWSVQNIRPTKEDAASGRLAEPKPRISDQTRRTGTASAFLIVSIIIGGTLFFQRKMVRTITFRRDKPVLSKPTRAALPPNGLKDDRSMIILQPFSGPPIEAPIGECELYDTDTRDRLLIGVPGKALRLLVDVDGAEVGIPGESQVVHRFDKDESGVPLSMEQKNKQRLDAKNLLGRLWATYERGNLSI